MQEKRRDSKGRLLWPGERQEKDGRYSYRYSDKFGRRKTVYSWKLTTADMVPKGKKQSESLRELEKRIQKDLEDQICSGGMTVLTLLDRYIHQKANVKYNTKQTYHFVRNIVAKSDFGLEKIETVTVSDAKLFLLSLQEEGRGYSSIHCVQGILRPSFQTAVDDDLIRKNPFAFRLTSIIANDSVTREALTKEQEEDFLQFIRNDPHYAKYYDGIYILFHTGMRISEFVGLTMADVDLDRKTIRIDHQLQRRSDGTKVIERTKTRTGTRTLPMTDDVVDCFRRLIQRRPSAKQETVIDGYSGFLCLDRAGEPMVAMHWQKYFQRICSRYHQTHPQQSLKVTPHICRHTYCTRMAKTQLSPKALQYLMGHADMDITYNTYTHISFRDVEEELVELGIRSAEK